MKTCAVIGSGIAGLASAIRAKKKGFDVTVFERNTAPGGKIAQFLKDGFRFDLGPSVFTLPELIDELFTLCNRNPRDYFNYVKLDPAFTYFYEDGTVIHAHANIDDFASEIASKTTDPAEQVKKYLKDIARIYDITNEVFIEQSLHIATNFLKRKVVSGVLRFRHIHAFHSMDEGNKRFFKDPKNVQLFNYYATYVGSNPLIAPATMNVIQHLEINLGTYMSTSGMYGIVDALYKLALDEGVQFSFNTEITKILVENNSAKGVKIGDSKILFDCIISNMDIHHTYERLLPHIKRPKLSLSQPRSNSVIVFNWAIKRSFDQLSVHNIFFTNSEETEYNAIETGTVSDDPSVYVYISSKIVEKDAPSGCENWFLLISVPHNDGQDWDSLVKLTNENCKSKISRMLGEDISSFIAFEHTLSPSHIADNYLAYKGAVFGNSANGRFAAFLRHPNFRRTIKNLYFSGGTVHPGAGIPMCLNSAKIVEGLIDKQI
jgi:phytoene desaturase